MEFHSEPVEKIPTQFTKHLFSQMHLINILSSMGTDDTKTSIIQYQTMCIKYNQRKLIPSVLIERTQNTLSEITHESSCRKSQSQHIE